MTDASQWQHAYALQAKADLATWQLLVDASAAVCHQYHFLQMTCEKVCKAFLCRQGSRPTDLHASHAFVAKTLPVLANDVLRELGGRWAKHTTLRFHLRLLKTLAREIELLAPSVDDGGRRPDNCEYPWEDRQGKLHVPAEFDFPSMRFLSAPVGRILPRLLHQAIASLLT